MPRLAVFSRNHLIYLQAAAEVGARSPTELVALRSAKPWTTAKEATDKGRPVPIYFAVIDEATLVRFEAELVETILDPTASNPRVTALLAKAPSSTADEGLWDGSVRTLYGIRACRQLEKPFSQTDLLLYDSGEALSPDYARSYALVRWRGKSAV